MARFPQDYYPPATHLDRMLGKASHASVTKSESMVDDLSAVEERSLLEKINAATKSITTDGAIEVGSMLIRLNLKPHEYQTKKINIPHKRALNFIKLATHPRMKLLPPEMRPRSWTICILLLSDGVTDRVFDRLLATPSAITSHQTRHNLRTAILFCKNQFKNRNLRALETQPSPTEDRHLPLDQIICGDAIEETRKLPDNSIALVLCSPPYGQQMAEFYPGMPDGQMGEWLRTLLDAIRPKLTEDGSVLMVIRDHVVDGDLTDMVVDTISAAKSSGWIRPEKLTWYKPDAFPFGSNNRPRACEEDILWFSKSRKPFVDLKICGRGSPHGKTRIDTVLTVPVSATERGIQHPAIYPVKLAQILIQTFSRVGDIVLDPFMGSGSTALAARSLARRFIGIELMPEYVDLVRERLFAHPSLSTE